MEELWKYAAGGALVGALGVVAGFWTKLKGALWHVANLFVQQVEIPTEEAHNALIAYLIATYRRSRIYDRMFGAWYAHRRDGRYGLVPYEQYGTRSMILWNGCVPFYFSNAVEAKARQNKTNNNNSNNDDVTKIFSTITFVRGCLNVENLLRTACDAANKLTWSNTSTEEQATNRFVIHYVPKRTEESDNRNHGSNGLAWYQQGHYRLIGITADELGKMPLHKGRALENLIFPDRIKGLINEIELWRNNRQWYLDKGIPWKRGWLLYGPPGTGKTALARAFAEDLNMPIYVFNLAEMSNHELLKSWTDMQVNVPSVALIEDIDNVFHGRENIVRRSGMTSLMLGGRKDDKTSGNHGNDDKARDLFSPLTFDCLLNCLDGVERTDGIFTIITTNDLAKIDPALGQPRKSPDGATEFISTRPGRVDKAVELTYMEPADKKKMAKRILGEYPDEYLKMLEFIDRYPEMPETPAQFQERCGQIALRCFWEETHTSDVIENGPMPREIMPDKEPVDTLADGDFSSIS
jgi:ATPase family associated with various cellular activities (AAA)